MSRSPSLFALTRRRFATPRSAALVIIALTALAAFVVSAAPRALVSVVRDEVAHQVANVPPTSRDLTAQVSGTPEFGPPRDPDVAEGWDDGAADVFGIVGQHLADNRDDFEPVLRDIVQPAYFAEFSDAALLVPETLPADAPFTELQLISEPALGAAVELVDGVWPGAWSGEGPIPFVLSDDAARTMAWPIGEERGTPDPDGRSGGAWVDGGVTYTLVGTVTGTDASADRWLHLPTALTASVFDDGNRRPTATSAAWVAPQTWELVAPLHRSYVAAWYPVDAAAAVDQDPRELLTAFRAATSTSVSFSDSGQFRARFESAVVDVLAAALARADAASAILAVAAVGPLAVSVALVVLASTLMIRRRRTDLALLSARGAPLARLRRLLAGEGLLLGVPVAVVATTCGVLMTPHDAGLLPTVSAVLVGFVPAIALAGSVHPATLARARADLDAPRRSRTRSILQLIVVLLAVAAVVQLIVRGVGGGIDPLVVVAPLLATVALALAVVRLHPLLIRTALGIARRGRGVVSLVGAARNLRDPAAGTTAVLAMLVAVAIAVFSSVVLATVDRGAVVAAERAVGADIQMSGPYFDQALVDRLRAVDGVRDAVGVLRGDYFSVTGPDGRASAIMIVTDTERLADIQRGMVGALPPGLIVPGAEPVQLIESTALAGDLGTTGATVADRPADVVGTLDRVLGLTVSTQFAVLDVVDYEALRGPGFFPRTVYVAVDEGADSQAVAAALSAEIPGTHATRLLTASTAEIQASPAVTALRIVLFAALALAVVLSVTALLLVAGVSRDARSRVVALLRSMGLDRRRARGVVAWEFVPLGVTALVGGIVLGAVLPLLVVLSIDLRPFTGGGAQPSLAVDPVLSGTLIAVVITALAAAVVAGVVSARTTSMATVLRTEED